MPSPTVILPNRCLPVPAAFLPTALEKLGWTAEQFDRYLNGAVQAMFAAGILILLFAVIRGLFAYAQTYMSERVSQSVAFDFRNDLFAKIQRLSFSYHDKNQTGQLMVRATDDVEKVRMFIGQGLLQATQAVVLLVSTLVILFFTNLRLTLVILPLLPVVMAIFVRLQHQRCARCSPRCRSAFRSSTPFCRKTWRASR